MARRVTVGAAMLAHLLSRFDIATLLPVGNCAEPIVVA
jgi:hypothetical protein